MIPPVNGVAGGKSSTSKVQATVLKNRRASTITEQWVRCLVSIENRQQFAYASDQCNFGRFTRLGAAGRITSCSRTFLASLSALGQASYFDVSGKKHSAVRERAIKKGLRRRVNQPTRQHIHTVVGTPKATTTARTCCAGITCGGMAADLSFRLNVSSWSAPSDVNLRDSSGRMFYVTVELSRWGFGELLADNKRLSSLTA